MSRPSDMRTVAKQQCELDLCVSKKREWTDAERDILRLKYETIRAQDIAQELGRRVGMVYRQAAKMGLKKSREAISSISRAKLLNSNHGSIQTRFQKGHAPANKGLRRPGYAAGRMRETQFKKGQLSGIAAQRVMPLGATRLIDGYLYRKIAEFKNVPYTRNWKLEHYLIWEKVYGPVPKKHALVFKDGDRGHVELDNLELITRGQLAGRNTIHKLPEDLKEVIRLNASVRRRIRRIQREKQDDRSAEPLVRDTRSPEGSRQADGS